MKDEEIRHRKDIREHLELLHRLYGEELTLHAVEQWLLVKKPKKLPEPQLDDIAKAQSFGRSKITFGQYEDEIFDDIPRDYLEWLADEGNKLQHYLRYTDG